MTEQPKKPCPRCDGIEVTWGNIENVRFCRDHLGEVIREIPISPTITTHTTDRRG
jgi:hypothetical protein